MKKPPLLKTPTYKFRDLLIRVGRLRAQFANAIKTHFPIGTAVVVVGHSKPGVKSTAFNGTIAHYCYELEEGVVVRIDHPDAEKEFGIWKTLVNKYPDAYCIQWGRIYLPDDWQARQALNSPAE